MSYFELYFGFPMNYELWASCQLWTMF